MDPPDSRGSGHCAARIRARASPGGSASDRTGVGLRTKEYQRDVLLGIAATGFVLSWAAAWKLSTRDARAGAARRSSRRSLRIGATLYLGLPFIGGLIPPGSISWTWVPLILLCIAGGAVATASWFLSVARLSVRCGSRGAAIVARVLAAAGALVWIGALLMPELDAAEDSLSSLYRTPLIQFGQATTLYDLLNDALQGYWSPLLLAAAAMPLASAAICASMLLLLRRTYPAAAPPPLLSTMAAQRDTSPRRAD